MKAKVLKSFHQFEEGKTYEFKPKHFAALAAKGLVEAEKPKRGRKKKEIKEEE